MKKTILIYGGIGAFILGGMFFAFPMGQSENADLRTGEIVGYLSMLVGLTTVVLGVRSISNSLKPDPFSFLSAFKSGFLIALIGSVGYALGWMIYYNTIGDNGMMDAYFDQAMMDIQNSSLPESEKAAQIESSESFRDLYLNNGWVMFGMSLLEILPLGLLISLISAFIFKRK